MPQNRDISEQLLAHVAEVWEEPRGTDGPYNVIAARDAGNAALLLELDELVPRFVDLLEAVTPEQYWSGLGTTLPVDRNVVPPSFRELDSISKLEEEYPLFVEDYAATAFTESESFLLPCLDRDYEAAFALARCEYHREQIMLTQAMLGDFDVAIEASSRLTEKMRRDYVLFVVVLELYRRDRRNDAGAIRERLSEEELCDWGGVQMALGVANRVPYTGYPYPDW